MQTNNYIIVFKNTEGKEIGRKHASSPKLQEYIQLLGQTHKGMTIDRITCDEVDELIAFI